MNFLPPQKYVEIMNRVASGESDDASEIDDAKKEYEEYLEIASARSNGWEASQVVEDKEIGNKITALISTARKSNKSKLTPLGIPGGKTEEGQ